MSVKDAYYIQDGEMVSSEGRWRLTFDKNKGTTLKGHGVRKNLTDDGTVIYYNLENKVLLPQTHCLPFAAEDKIYRLEYFSTVELVEGGGYRIVFSEASLLKSEQECAIIGKYGRALPLGETIAHLRVRLEDIP